MNKILLINRLNPNENSNDKKKIFFLIGDMHLPSVENRLINSINNSKLIDNINDIVYKYNGVELNINIQKIPIFVKKFVEANISIYSIFEVYDPEL